MSGLPLQVQEATGADELIVLEPGWSPVATIVTLASRIATDAQGRVPAWDELPAADVSAIALTIRQTWLGKRISTDARCPHPGCLERMDIAFEIPAYLAHHCPQPQAGVRPGRDVGWFEFADAHESPGAAVSFRLPTIGDLRAALAEADPERCLRERCVRPSEVSADVAQQISRAMAALAPSLTETVTVQCPACGNSHELHFDPVSYSLTELRDAAAGLYEEVYLLASAFHWSEDAILSLPRSRRARYAERIRREGASA